MKDNNLLKNLINIGVYFIVYSILLNPFYNKTLTIDQLCSVASILGLITSFLNDIIQQLIRLNNKL